MTILRYVFLSLVIFIAAAVSWRSAGVFHPRDQAQSSAATRQRVDLRSAEATVPAALTDRLGAARSDVARRLAEVPQFAGFFKDLATGFPHVSVAVIDHAARALSAGESPPSPSALLWEALRNLQQSNGILAAGADEAALASFFDARLAMLDVLGAADASSCADFLYGSTDPSIDDFSTRHRDLVADLATKQLAAIEDGQRRHLDPGKPSAEDLDLVAQGLAARKLSPDEVAMLLDGKPLDPPLPDTRLCEIGRTYLSVLKDLPSAIRHRIYGFAAELLARS